MLVNVLYRLPRPIVFPLRPLGAENPGISFPDKRQELLLRARHTFRSPFALRIMCGIAGFWSTRLDDATAVQTLRGRFRVSFNGEIYNFRALRDVSQ